MHSTSRKTVLAIVAILVVAAALFSERTFRRKSSPTLENESTPDARVKTPPPPQRAHAAGEAVTKDGTHASFTSFSTSDGNWFSQWTEFHGSPRSARRALEFALKHATEIIRREPMFDDSGHQVGEKAVATFSGKYAYYGDASLLWTNGSEFRYVAGASLQGILDYEKGSP
jgi:hypothetical protein